MTAVLKMTNIQKRFGTGHTEVDALTDVNFSIAKDSFVSVIGPSGSGKSTFLTIAGGLQRPTAGKIWINGTDISDLNERQRTQIRFDQLGFILQSSNLVPFLKVHEQFRLVEKLAHHSLQERTDRLLKELDIDQLQHKYPKELSGGEKQRVAIVRALCNDPSLILADEPTASLDSKHAFEVVKILAKEAHEQHKAIIMVTHDERMTQWSDQIYQIEDGHLALKK
ncbi:ABC transporter ATP-binding protein [Pediococcus siamensis]|uniref:ABC transporter ATP-binding protein n=1 Tax=Pediococcus siamensis TaxID=381829 RepID=UPI0039A2656C